MAFSAIRTPVRQCFWPSLRFGPYLLPVVADRRPGMGFPVFDPQEETLAESSVALSYLYYYRVQLLCPDRDPFLPRSPPEQQSPAHRDWHPELPEQGPLRRLYTQ